jgi:DNA ligase (NAD+)
VLVTRRGGVIPKVESVVAPGTEPLVPPELCPSCGSSTVWEGDFLYCSTPQSCRTARIGELEHYCSVTEMLGFGERVLAAGWDAGVLRSLPDLYRLDAAQLGRLDRIGEKTAQNLLAQVESRRTLPLAVFLRALGVPELGSHVSTLLAQQYGALERIRALTVEELAGLHSVGEIIARSVVEGLRERSALIDDLLTQVKLTAPEAASGDGPLSGLSFVFTGKLGEMDRKVAQVEVRKLGAETPSGVSATLSFLVVGEEKDGAESSKLRGARKHNEKGAGIVILDEAGFQTLLADAKRGVRPSRGAP